MKQFAAVTASDGSYMCMVESAKKKAVAEKNGKHDTNGSSGWKKNSSVNGKNETELK